MKKLFLGIAFLFSCSLVHASTFDVVVGGVLKVYDNGTKVCEYKQSLSPQKSFPTIQVYEKVETPTPATFTWNPFSAESAGFKTLVVENGPRNFTAKFEQLLPAVNDQCLDKIYKVSLN
jgi:hypothetical protein